MKCFNCGARQTKTIYPKFQDKKFVQKWCIVCGWKSFPTQIPEKLPLFGDE